MKRKYCLGLFAIFFSLFSLQSLKAGDSVETQIKDKQSDLKKSYNKGTRKLKKEARKAKGENTPAKDAKDAVEDLGDDLNNASEKLEHRVNQ